MKTKRLYSTIDPFEWESRLIWNSILKENGCREWTGKLDKNGYGFFRFSQDGKKRMTGSHRAAWLVWRGDIEGNLVIDHLCRNRSCINPDHLELVTTHENILRGARMRVNATKQGCKKHGTSDAYLILKSDGYTRWTCRICRRISVNAYRNRRIPPSCPRT